MLDWIVYFLLGGVVSGVLCLVYGMIRTGPGKKEFRFGQAALIISIFVYAAPFGLVELQTMRLKKELDPVVKKFFRSPACPLFDDMHSFKVLFSTNTSASVLLIGKEQDKWGGYDYPVMRLQIKKTIGATKSVWKVEDSEVIRSERLDKDNFVLPPYLN
jgi:hypothetical protein